VAERPLGRFQRGLPVVLVGLAIGGVGVLIGVREEFGFVVAFVGGAAVVRGIVTMVRPERDDPEGRRRGRLELFLEDFSGHGAGDGGGDGGDGGGWGDGGGGGDGGGD
jgi:hypothetical protein